MREIEMGTFFVLLIQCTALEYLYSRSGGMDKREVKMKRKDLYELRGMSSCLMNYFRHGNLHEAL